MRYSFQVICMTALLVNLALSACKSSSQKQTTAASLTGKLVISEICNHLVVAVESGEVNSDWVTTSYKDEKRGTTFDRVFTVENSCSFIKSGLKEGDRFSFDIPAKPEPDTCMVCMAYYPTPPTKLSVTNIRKID